MADQGGSPAAPDSQRVRRLAALAFHRVCQLLLYVHYEYGAYIREYSTPYATSHDGPSALFALLCHWRQECALGADRPLRKRGDNFSLFLRETDYWGATIRAVSCFGLGSCSGNQVA